MASGRRSCSLLEDGTDRRSRGLRGGAEGIRTDGHRGRSEVSSYFSPVNARSLLVARALSIAIDSGLRCSLLGPLAGAAEAASR